MSKLASIALMGLLAAAPGHYAMAQNVQAQSSGKVIRVDQAKGKIALQHGAIPKLELPAMTLVYLIDGKLLLGIAVGDNVNFTAERAGGKYRIIELKK